MKCSIIIAIYNSHEIVRRQLLHFESIGIPDDMELILVDDGSASASDTFVVTVNPEFSRTWGVSRLRSSRRTTRRLPRSPPHSEVTSDWAAPRNLAPNWWPECQSELPRQNG